MHAVAFLVLDFVYHYYASKLAGRTISKVMYFCQMGHKTSVNQTVRSQRVD